MRLQPAVQTYRVGHLFCGIGAGAAGFNDANPRVHGMSGRFVCAGGVDVDPGAIENFDQIAGAKGTVMDLFDREQYVAFHGKEPPAGWREATPADIRRAHGDAPLDVMFLSAPCKGFSGLLSAKASGHDKYQALNALTVRGVWLTLEAYKDRPIRIILFENVLRILTRGRALLDKIQALLRAYGYVFAETTHNCGEIGELAQSRNRMLMVARHAESVPPFLYQPAKHRLRGVGEVIGLLPLPGDPIAGEMHRVPRLQWKTWVRLAFVPAGKDWRALNDLAVENGHLRDFGIVPDLAMRDNQLGVLGWGDTAPVLTGQRSPAQGRFSVADIRVGDAHNDMLGVRDWTDPARVVAGASRPATGAISVADPRPVGLNAEGREGYATQGHYGVLGWTDSSNAVPGYAKYDRGNWSVADPRDLDGEAAPVPALPKPDDRLVARIIAQDGTWHRPFTTLELAALQSIFDPEEVFGFDPDLAAWQRRADFALTGGSDQVKREWIGNAVPRKAARGMAETIGETLLLADMGETFVLSSRAIWTKPLALALAVDPRQTVCGEAVV